MPQSYTYDGVYKLKTIRKTFFMLIIFKNYEYLNVLKGAVFLYSQANTNT